MGSVKAGFLLPLIAFSGTGAVAATATTNMAVSATVQRSCTVSAGPLAFGTLAPGSVADANSVISIECTSANPTETTVSVSTDDGANNDDSQRRMVNADLGGAYVPYGLYAAAGGTDPIAPGETIPATTTDNGRSFTATIYGQVPASNSYAVGSYSDTVVIELTYSDQPGPVPGS